MKGKIKVALIQFGPKWLKPQENAESMKKLADEAGANGAELIMFPELSNTGYITPALPGQQPSFGDGVTAGEFAAKYVAASEHVPGPTTDLLGEITHKYGLYIVLGVSQLHPVIPATLFNAAVLIGPAGVIGVQHKMHIPMNEKMFFYPGNTAEVFNTPLGNIGMTICYDNRFPEISRVLALRGAEIICTVYSTPGSAPSFIANPDYLKYRAFVRAQENEVYYLACNRTGREGETEFLGGAIVAAPNGNIDAYSQSPEGETLTAEIFGDEIIKHRAQVSVFRDRRPDMYADISRPFFQPSQGKSVINDDGS